MVLETPMLQSPELEICWREN